MYEITFINKTEDNQKIRKLIEALGGKISSSSSLGRRKLAYPIKKENAGFYTTFVFALDKEKTEELNKKLRSEGEILRYLITEKRERVIKKKVSKEKKELTSAPMKKEETKIVKAVKEEVTEKPAEAQKPTPPKKFEKEIKPKIEEKAVKPKIIKPAVEPKEVQVTEDERLKALEDKLSELLKD